MTKLNLFFKYILEQPIKIIKIWTYVMFDDLSEDEDSLSIFHNLDFFLHRLIPLQKISFTDTHGITIIFLFLRNKIV